MVYLTATIKDAGHGVEKKGVENSVRVPHPDSRAAQRADLGVTC